MGLTIEQNQVESGHRIADEILRRPDASVSTSDQLDLAKAFKIASDGADYWKGRAQHYGAALGMEVT